MTTGQAWFEGTMSLCVEKAARDRDEARAEVESLRLQLDAAKSDSAHWLRATERQQRAAEEVRAEIDRLRTAYQQEHGDLIKDALDQTIKATRWEAQCATVETERDALRAEVERLTKERDEWRQKAEERRDRLVDATEDIERDTAERIAAWLESRVASVAEQCRQAGYTRRGADLGVEQSALQTALEAIRSGAWRGSKA